MQLKGRMQVTSWQEDELRTVEHDGAKVTRASVGYRMTGDVEAEAVDDLVMYYRPDGSAAVMGLWQVTGAAAGRTGTVIFESSGGFDGTTATAAVRTVPGSSTAGFVGVRGTGTIRATSENVEYALELEF